MNRETFRQPGDNYRELPFWSWNDDLRLTGYLMGEDTREKQIRSGAVMPTKP